MGKIINYKNDGANGVYSQIRLDDGSRVLISLAGTEIKIIKMIFGGIIPAGTVWEYLDIVAFFDMIIGSGGDKLPLNFLVEKVLTCNSIDDLKMKLNNFCEENKGSIKNSLSMIS